jgi:hypothetical protein
MLKVNSNSWDQWYPTVGTLSWLQKASNLEKHMKWHHFHQYSWKEDILPPLCQWGRNPNPPESMPEAITGTEIMSSKPIMHMHTCIMISGHTLGIFNECWLFPPPTIDYGLSLEQQHWAKSEISDFKEIWLNCIIWKRILNNHWYRKDVTTTNVPTHTQTQPQHSYFHIYSLFCCKWISGISSN